MKGLINSILLQPEIYHNRDRVEIHNKNIDRVNKPYPYSINMRIVDLDSNKKIIIGFDLQDWDFMFSHNSLKNCKILFKRAYSQNNVDLVQKAYPNIQIQPFGFTYNTNFINKNYYFMSQISRLVYNISYTMINLKNFHRFYKKFYNKFSIREHSKNNITTSNIKPLLHPYIFFQVEYHSLKNHFEADKINNYRSIIIKALKQEFGNQFVGGMWSKDILDMKFNDCQSAYLDRETHLSLMKNASIVISTNGFGNSLPWKLAEYCKLGKCIVSEELTHELPNPLIKGVHLEIYNDVDQCINFCRELLKNSKKANELGENAREYYKKHIDPKVVINEYIHQSINQYS